MPVKPTIIRHPDKVEVIIPANSNWIMMLVMIVMLAFWWITGGVIAINALIDKRELDAGDWIWATWGIAVILVLLRNIWVAITGKERILFTSGTMTVKRGLLSSADVYDLPKICRMEAIEMDENYSIFDGDLPDATGRGTIRFRYLDRYIRIGNGLSQQEADKLLQALRSKNILSEKNIS